MNAIKGLGAILVIAVAGSTYLAHSAIAHPSRPSLAPILVVPKSPPESLDVSKLVDATARSPKPSSGAERLNGQRVRVTGYMAQLEVPPKGGFYLTAHPVTGDESGAGTGDLPLDSLLVLPQTLADQPIATTHDRLEVNGILELGRGEDSEGRVHWFRLRLDPSELF